MLILPIVNRDRILNVAVKLKGAEKIRTGVSFDDAVSCDVIVNGKKFSDSVYKGSREEDAILDFIRTNSLVYKRNFLVTTKEYSDSSLYDVYEVEQPPKKVTEGLDNLYSQLLTDKRKEIPEHRKGRYLSLEKLGVANHLTDAKIAKLQQIVNEVRDSSQRSKMFSEAGVSDLVDTLTFLNNFDCTVIPDSTIPEDTMQKILQIFSILNTKDTKNLQNYYNIALSNRDIYGKISYIHKIIYGKPFTLIQSKSQKQKQFAKTSVTDTAVGGEKEYQKVA